MAIGVLLVLIVVPWMAWDWDAKRWRHPLAAVVMLLLGGYALAAGPG